MKQLPVFKDWTVDFRLKEFRKVKWEELDGDGILYPRMTTMTFKSQKGDQLLGTMIKKGLVPKDILASLF